MLKSAQLRAAPARRLAAGVGHREWRRREARRRPPAKGGWSFEGNTLTTVIPVASSSVASRVTVEVRRAVGLTARRDDLDGFAGAMTRLRGAYDAMQKTWPVSAPPDQLIDAMQTGDRLGYHPEKATEEIEHFHAVLTEAQEAVDTIQRGFAQRMDDYRQTYEPAMRCAMSISKLQKKNRMDA